jgi:hypothetical protein
VEVIHCRKKGSVCASFKKFYDSIPWGSNKGRSRVAARSLRAPSIKDIVLEIASKTGGFEAATEILHLRLLCDQKEKQKDAPEIIEAGRELIRQLPFGETRNTRLDARLGVISKLCLCGQEGQVVVDQVCRKLKDAEAKHEVRASDYDNLIGGLFEAQPTAALDAFCGGNAQELASCFRIIRALRQNPLDSMPESGLFAWCDQKPTIRYPEVASAITVSCRMKEGETPQWANRSLHLLNNATDRVAVLERYVAQIGSASWDAATMASNVKLLDMFRTHTDPGVAKFIAQESARLGQIADARRNAEREAERERVERFE